MGKAECEALGNADLEDLKRAGFADKKSPTEPIDVGDCVDKDIVSVESVDFVSRKSVDKDFRREGFVSEECVDRGFGDENFANYSDKSRPEDKPVVGKGFESEIVLNRLVDREQLNRLEGHKEVADFGEH